MPSLSEAAKVGKLVTLGLVLLLGVTLVYCQLTGRLSSTGGTLASLAYLVTIVGAFFATGIAPLPEHYRTLFGGGRSSVADFAKTALCLIGSLLWVAVLVRLVPDTVAGAVVLFVPGLIIFGASVYFFARALGLIGK